MRGSRNINTHIKHTLNLRVRLILINILNSVIPTNHKNLWIFWQKHSGVDKSQKGRGKQQKTKTQPYCTDGIEIICPSMSTTLH